MTKLNVGIIGLGNMGSQHYSNVLQGKCPEIDVVAIADINPDRLEWAKNKNKEYRLTNDSIPEPTLFSNADELIQSGLVQAVIISVPHYDHPKYAISAFKHGLHVMCEKPIGVYTLQAKEMIEEADRHPELKFGVMFNQRTNCLYRKMKEILDSGALGDIVGVNVSYLKDSAFWEGRRLEWRFVKSEAGSGVLGDLGVHLIDLAQLLCGEITEVCAIEKTVVKERPTLDGNGIGRVETDDMCAFLATFECGAHGSFHITRCAIGNKNTIKYDVYGTRGSISFNLNNPEVLDICVGEGDPRDYEFKTVEVPKEFFTTQARAFIDSINGKTDALYPTIADGAQGQLIIDSLLKSAGEKRWIAVEG